MSEQPFNLKAKNFEEAMRQVQLLIDDLYQERLAGAQPGDVFTIDQTSDVLTLTLASTSGLTKTGGALAVLPKPAGSITITTDGVDVLSVSITKPGLAPMLPNDALKFLNGVGGWTAPNGLTAAITVVSETAFGESPVVGSLTTFAREDHTHGTPDISGYQATGAKNAANGYAGLNASTRTTKGVDTTDDVIIDLATKGVVLKDTQATPHYWRLTNTVGVASFVDIGTVKP